MAMIAPALGAADLADLGRALKQMESAGATMVHLDVGDGHFSSDVTMGQPMVASLRKATRLALDVHLQIERPERFAAEFVKLGAARVAIHIEAARNPLALLESIRSAGAKAGVAINPETPWGEVTEVAPRADFVLIVQAHETRASAPHGAIEKIRQAASWRQEHRSVEIAVEGGVDIENAASLTNAGADILIAGKAIFQSRDPEGQLKAMAAKARPTARE